MLLLCFKLSSCLVSNTRDTSVMYEKAKGALAIRRIFSLVYMITKPKFSNCHNVLKTGLFR